MRAALVGLALVWATLAAALPVAAGAAVDPAHLSAYMPTGLVHNVRSAGEVDGYLSDLAEYDIGRPLLQMPPFKPNGVLKVPRHERATLGVWVSQAAAYDAAHATHTVVTAVFNANLKAKGPNLEDPAVRANMIAGVESVVALGVGGVQLDVEPYPQSPGFLSLLEELRGALSAHGFDGPVSLVAPASTSRWSPQYLRSVGALVDELDPLYYESELATPGAYEDWVRQSLAYYAANAPAGTAIVPVIPSYKANRWHSTAAENVASATAAIEAALGEGSRVEGVGLWWWYGFFYDEEGAFDGAADRAAWQSQTVGLTLTP